MDSGVSRGVGGGLVDSKSGAEQGFVTCCGPAKEIYFECMVKVESLCYVITSYVDFS